MISSKIVKENLSIDTDEVVKFIAHRQIHGFKKTLLKNVNNLEAGHILEYDIDKKEFKVESYLNYISGSSSNQHYYSFEQNLDNVISQQSITEHKKIACFLSGGLDLKFVKHNS